jgi:hypothetical protein
MFRMVAILKEVFGCGILEDGNQPKHVAAKLGDICMYIYNMCVYWY